MNALAILERLGSLGVSVTVADDALRLVPGSKVPPELIEELRQHKAAVIAYLSQSSELPQPGEVVGELERLLRLGQALKAGRVKALRCGITGKRCTACEGVPCWGSAPWEGL